MSFSFFLFIFICILFSAYFSGVEIAFLTSNKLKIELENKQGGINSKIIYFFSRNPSQFIATLLLGNNIALVIYGIFMAILLEEPISYYIWDNSWFVLLLQTILSTVLILFTGEFIPKAIFRINPNGILKALAIPTFIIFLLLYIPSLFTIGLAELIMRMFRTKTTEGKGPLRFGRLDLDMYLEEVTQHAAQKREEIDQEIEIFRNALDFSKVRIRDCMIPRMEIEAIEVDEPVSLLREKFVRTRLSKILVYRENIDNIIGYVHSYELFKEPTSIKSMLLPISIIPETIPANEVLEEFTRQSRSIAVVVDEFGGTSGIVTMEDIIEEIFGEIEDEHDTIELVEQDLGHGEYLFSGRLEVDYLNSRYQLGLQENDDYETLAGFILFHTADIPENGTIFYLENHVFQIMEVSGTRIELVKISRPKE